MSNIFSRAARFVWRGFTFIPRTVYGGLQDALTPDIDGLSGPEGPGGRVDLNVRKIGVQFGNATQQAVTIYGFKRVSNPDDDDNIHNDLLHCIIVLGEAGRDIGQVYLDGYPVTSDQFKREKGSDRSSAYAQRFPNGMQGYSDPDLIKSGYDPQKHLFTNKCCVYVRLEWSPNQMPQELPITVDWDGWWCWPLSKTDGATLPKDSLDHRNHAVAIANYLHHRRFGLGLNYSRLDIDSFIGARSDCFEQVPKFEGSDEKEPLHLCDVFLDTAQSVGDNLNKLLDGCNGILTETNGIVSLKIPKREAPTFHLSDGSDGQTITLRGYQDPAYTRRREQYTHVEATFIDGKTGKKRQVIYPKTLPVNSDLNPLKLDLHTCSRETEADRQAEHEFKKAQNRLGLSADGLFNGLDVQCGQVVSLTIKAEGFKDKPFRVENRHLQNGLPSWDLLEHQDEYWDWHNKNPPEIPDTIIPDPTNVEPPTDIDAELVADGGIKFTWFSLHQNFEIAIEKDGQKVHAEQVVTRDFILNRSLDVGEYVFKVRAFNRIRWSPFAGYVFTLSLPQPPTIEIVAVTDTAITLRASALGHGFNTRYEWQYRGETGEFEGSIVELNPFTAGALKPETEYFFRSRTVNPVGSSDWSEISVKTAVATGVSHEDFQSVVSDALDRFEAQRITNDDFQQAINRIEHSQEGSLLADLADYAQNVEDEIIYETLSARQDSAEANYARLVYVTAAVDRASVNLTEVMQAALNENAIARTKEIELTVTPISASLVETISRVGKVVTPEGQYSAGLIDRINIEITPTSQRVTDAESLMALAIRPDGSFTSARINEVKQVIVDDEEGAISEHIKSYEVEHAGKKVTLQQVVGASISADGNSFSTQFTVFEDPAQLRNGFGFINRNGVTLFVVSANKFVVFDPVTQAVGDSPFTVQNGITKIKEGRVTGKLRSSPYIAGQHGWSLEPNGNAYFNNAYVRGDVRATSLAANVVTAESIQAGAISADMLDANSITTKHIKAGALTSTMHRTYGRRYLGRFDNHPRLNIELFRSTFDASDFSGEDYIIIHMCRASIDIPKGLLFNGDSRTILGKLYQLDSSGREQLVFTSNSRTVDRNAEIFGVEFASDTGIVKTRARQVTFVYRLTSDLRNAEWKEIYLDRGEIFARGANR